MEKNKNFSLLKRIKSFGYAIKGIILVFKKEHNAWIHLLAVLVVVTLGFYTQLNSTEWCLVVFAMGLVISAELFNTAIEYLTNHIFPNFDEKAGNIKDIAAGAVLIAAIAAAIIGIIVFVPKLF